MKAARPIFEVSPEVFSRWPGYVVGCVFAAGIDNTLPSDVIDQRLASVEADIHAEFRDADPKYIAEIAIWRSVFSSAGWTPSKYLSSVEAIVKRVARGQPLPRVNPIVDLANECSLRFRVPIGAHDVSTLGAGTLTVRPAAPTDSFLPMGDAPPETADPDEIVYASATSIRTRRWVWRQSRVALIQPTTTDVFFPIDGFDPETISSVRAAIEYLAMSLRHAFTVEVRTSIVDAGVRTFSILG